MVIKNIDKTLITKKFLRRGFNIHPDAVKLLQKFEPEILEDIISISCKLASNRFIVTEDDIGRALNVITKDTQNREEMRKDKTSSGVQVGFNAQRAETTATTSNIQNEIQILKDVTGCSFCEGKVEDFVYYFNSRFEKLTRILSKRIQPTPISNVGRVRNGKVNVIGIVSDVRSGRSAHIIELEDKTGRITCIATGKIREIAEELIGDEVIGVTGSIRDKVIIADRIFFPDVPVNGKKEIKKDFSIVFISDTHFGSKEFLEREWNAFMKWLNGEVGNKKMQELAESVKYVIVAGDVVDGVGIYPEQEKDLEITDIYQQYECAAEHFDGFPERVRVLLSPGNHDAVRQAEPQPALPKEIKELFPRNVVHVGNPVYISLEGVKILIYHGRSIDDMVAKIPRLNYSEPHKVMEEMLKRRHLSPMYGGRTPLAPEKEDYLVIEDVPDVLHCGHVHTYGTGFYRGVFLVNSSTWQEQTEFQKKVNLNPMPCNAAVYTPGGEVVRLKFHGG